MGDRIVVSFDDFSYADVIGMSSLSATAVKMQLVQMSLTGKDKLTKAEEKSIQDALAASEQAVVMQRQLFAKTVRALPQDMFVSAAPPVADLDLRDPDTYLLLKATAVNPLRAYIEEQLRVMQNEGKY